MARQRLHQTAAGQASLLFVLAGILGLVSETLLIEESPRPASIGINIAAILFSLVLYAAPWHRWSARTSLLAVPVALGLVVVGQRVCPGAPTVYGVWFVVMFAWIGFWHPPRTALWLAPATAAAYVAPFIGVASTPHGAIASVAMVIPAGAILGEVLASKMNTIHQAQRALVEARTLLERANLTDDLTGVGNRRRANSLLDGMQPGDGLALLDLDHFKQVNDTRGHAEGDRILSELGTYLLRTVREADTVARFGGEEFIVLLRGAGSRAAEATERLISGWRDEGHGVTLSAGAALHTAGRALDATFRAADAAMYEAKRQGRDRVVMHDDDPKETSGTAA
jgi:diguanylate cyclase (GGDEF)-like protein